MRTSDIPYVSNNAAPTYVPALEDMTLQDITKNYLRTCAKSGGKLSMCKECTQKCKYGTRALDLFTGKAYMDAPAIPTETILEKIKLAKEAEEKKPEPPKKINKRQRLLQEVEERYRKAIVTADPAQALADMCNISKKKAYDRIYMYRRNNPERAAAIEKELNVVNVEKILTSKKTKPVPAQEIKPVQETKPVIHIVPAEPAKEVQEDNFTHTLKEKVLTLVQKQQEFKAKIEEHQKKIQEYTDALKEVQDKIDVLNMCMDVFNS